MKKITCIVDNTVQQGSLFWGEHGLAFRLEVDQTCALFDTGRSGSVLLHNLGLLGGCPREASALILSHAHIDHKRPIIAVTGGTHLIDADESHVQHIIAVLRGGYASPRLYLNHCTGQQAHVALANVLGDRVKPCPAGTTLTFD
jgi:metal-dependent hydrolase (beta-lactamase superfamily II)